MSSIELNAKKIETLTKVARLLGDQLREQNNKIEQLQIELEKLKELFKSKIESNSAVLTEEKDIKIAEQIKPTLASRQAPEVAKLAQQKATARNISSEKEELRKALKIIEEL